MDEVLGPLSAMIFMGWLLTAVLGHMRRSRITKAQVETRGKILEKIGAGQEMMQFMASEAGQQMLEPLPTEAVQETPKQYSRILRAIQAGLVLFALGVGFIFVPIGTGTDKEAITVLSTLGLALGAGFLLAGLASYLLSKNWGLLNGASQSE
jgi:TRAP-type mannitol/chloroaromatic compound transport system permease large subunit